MQYVDTVSGDDPVLWEWLREGFEKAESVSIRTGFLSRPAVDAITDAMTAYLDRGGHLLIVAGGAPIQADLDALTQLAALIRPYPRAALRVVLHPEEFQNAKTYHLRYSDGHTRALVGSANLTTGGMESNHEAVITLDSTEPGEADVIVAVLKGIEEFRNRPGTSPMSEEIRGFLLYKTNVRKPLGYKPSRPLKQTQRWDDILQPTLDTIDMAASGASLGVPTGFRDLDLIVGGWLPGTLTAIGGRPGLGRTSLLLTSARRAAISLQIPTALFSLDRTTFDASSHILCAEASINRLDMRDGRMSDDDWTRLAEHMSRTSDAPLWINTTPGASLSRLCSHITDLVRSEGLKLVAIDSMNSIDAGLDPDAGRERELSVIGRRLKLLALELDVPILVTAEIGKGPEKRIDRRPTLFDFRDSEILPLIADTVLLLHRPDADDYGDTRQGEADIIVAKQRGGPVATITVRHELRFGRFVDERSQ
ncbi:DnaB-like helicase C-terminal domain-containing protein [Mycobacteroides abscessus]|uniref:DnaB-like helicase C-terminal domain-containing protein n=1 Tax=Mycobacteroides abscessus TaxID=36809 RepID=UPI0009285F66|nr:DnaB-like helicase C-terminal domain-containing protein [Mycobacteroides abscessus]SII49557.1 replicative DNA helicase [Mycobacteroides abscessus subsp. abscessus]SLI88367.1 replicative DNA helicase [Mycobacteroides abscessus subsp. abscessus]